MLCNQYLWQISVSLLLVRKLVFEVTGSCVISYQEEEFDLEPQFRRMTVKESILEHNPTLTDADLESEARMREILVGSLTQSLTGMQCFGTFSSTGQSSVPFVDAW